MQWLTKYKKITDFQNLSVHSVANGTENIKFFRPRIWKVLLHEIKKLENLKELKTAIKNGNQHHVQEGYVTFTLGGLFLFDIEFHTYFSYFNIIF